MQLQERTQEAFARRAAKKVGLIAKKSRKHLGSIENYGGFQLVDQRFNYVVAGSGFEMSPADVIEYCTGAGAD